MRPDPSPYKILETMAVLAMASTAIGLLLHRDVFLGLALVLLAAGIFFKRAAGVMARSWLRFAQALGILNGRVILTILFFLILTPIALLYRAVNGDAMRLKRKSLGETLWTERNQRYEAKDLEKTW